MKKILFVSLVLFLVLGAGGIFAFTVQTGFLTSNKLNGADVRLDIGPLTAEAQAGFGMLRFANPTVEIDGEELSIPATNLELNAHAYFVRAGILVNWWRPPHMVVYSGLRGTMGLLGADFNMRDEWDSSYDDLTLDLGATMFDVQGLLLGWDWSIPGVPNAVFSLGVGVQRCWVSNLTGTLALDADYMDEPEEITIAINPGLSGWSSFVEIGGRISMGRRATKG